MTSKERDHHLQILYSYLIGIRQFASLGPFRVMSAASRRLRFGTRNSEGVHRCCCLSATSNPAEKPLLLSADGLVERLTFPASRHVRCGSATWR